MRTGIVVVDRMALYARFSRRRSTREPSVEMPTDQVFRTYRGFDGQVWPQNGTEVFEVRDGMADVTAYSAIMRHYQQLGDRAQCDVIALSPVNLPMPLPWVPLGFDWGYFNSEWSHYSLVLNEILFGNKEPFRRLAAKLNKDLLFSNPNEVVLAAKLRDAMLERGEDLEDGVMEAVGVYAAAPNH